MTEQRYHIVFNAASGTANATGVTRETLAENFEAAGLQFTIDDDMETPLAERITAALDGDAEVIVAAGGDGTITALAEALVGTNKTLAVLPLGTANLLARDLAIPLDLKQAVAAIPAMETRRMDVAEVNGRVFLHNVTVGFAAGIAVGREQLRGRADLGAKIGFLRYFFRRVQRARRIAVELVLDEGEMRVGRVHAVTVANNSYDQGLGQVFTRTQLDAGHLGLYVLKHFSMTDLFRLSMAMLLGRWQDEEAVDVETVHTVTIRTKRPTIMAMIDGEIESMNMPLHFTIRPQALAVLAPVPAPAAAAAELATIDIGDPQLVVGA